MNAGWPLLPTSAMGQAGPKPLLSAMGGQRTLTNVSKPIPIPSMKVRSAIGILGLAGLVSCVRGVGGPTHQEFAIAEADAVVRQSSNAMVHCNEVMELVCRRREASGAFDCRYREWGHDGWRTATVQKEV